MSTTSRLSRRVAPREVLPDLAEEFKAMIVKSIRWAWAEVSQRWPELVASGDEESISASLADLLNEQDTDGGRRAPGLSSFETIQRGGKVQGADGCIEYQPDLVFRPYSMPPLVRNRSSWGWFVECKLVDGARLERHYCRNGVQRFVEGRYAARMPSGAMLGYARDGREPYTCLKPLLSGRYGNSTVEQPDASTSSQIRSRHERLATTPIELTHLWLQASSTAPG